MTTLLSALVAAGLATAAHAAPNILVVIADDCTFSDLGCYGGQADTPHLDRLASEGMRFTRCFQAAPMCSPTRHNLYTGLYPVTSGAYPNHTFVKDGTKSIATYFGDAGYRVALSGKTHVAPKSVFSFEYSGERNNPDMTAVDDLLSACSAEGTPFVLIACSNEPHSPWDKGDRSRYDPSSLSLPPTWADTPETRDGYSRYLAEITYFDSQVGQCLDALDRHGHADDTIVMVLSEQGSAFPFAKWSCYDAGLQSGMIVRWPGTVAPASEASAMVEYVDVLPTFLEAAGLPRPTQLEGASFLPVLRGDRSEHKDVVFGMMTTRGINDGSDHYGIRSARSSEFKYIRNLTPEVTFQNACVTAPEFQSWIAKAKAGDADAAEKVRRYQHRPGEELYAVGSDDPLEWKNLADDPEYAKIKAELSARLDAWMEACGDLGQATELAAHDHQGRKRRKAGKRP